MNICFGRNWLAASSRAISNHSGKTILAIHVHGGKPNQYRKRPHRSLMAMVPMAFAAATLSTSAASGAPLTSPLSFFEGRTESVSMVKVIAKKPFQSRSIGRGEIGPDGTLHLVQRVEEDGQPPFDRRWRIRQVGPGRFSGTMSEAKGLVAIEEVGGRYRFRFKMKGMSVEQWLTPLPGGRSARSAITIRKLGLTVGHCTGTIRKL